MPKGALIETDFDGLVGYNLDEIPEHAYSDATDYVLNKVSLENWKKRVFLQLILTQYRQIYRPLFIDKSVGQLTLPPRKKWKVNFTTKPYKTLIQGHKYVVRNYSFYSVLIGREDSVAKSQQELTKIDGEYIDSQNVPVDPEHIFQRIGYACADEASYSLDTVNSENIWNYYDDNCQVETYVPIQNRTVEMNLNMCHWTSYPNRTCMQALEDEIGYQTLNIHWKRIKWSNTIASQYRVDHGREYSPYADIMGYDETLLQQINIGYKYFYSNSCTLGEGGNSSSSIRKGCIGDAGWRQLLRFTSTSVNIGKTSFHVGSIFEGEYLKRGVFEYDKCHLHYHYNHYENYVFSSKNIPGRKTGFCIQTTSRLHNNEYVSFNTPYWNCTYQGIATGWADDYTQGLDCQWIDVTNFVGNPRVQQSLKIVINPDNFVCEGKYDLYPNGSIKWILTPFLTRDFRPVYRPACNFQKNYAINNVHKVMVDFKGRLQTLVTMPCKRKATLSPTKDCNFNLVKDNLKCIPNQPTTVNIKNINPTGDTAVIRICESSRKLGHSTLCEYALRLKNVMIAPGVTNKIEFICPAFRDLNEPGGLYSILVSNLIPTEPIPSIQVL